MRQEIKFCADIYRLLYEHIDTSEGSTVYLCLDGSAAEKGVREHLLRDESLPDFYWLFKGGTTPFLMEAKVVLDGTVRFCGDGQPTWWCDYGTGSYKPVLWLGIDEVSPKFYVWKHSGFEKTLSQLVGKGRTAGGRKKTLTAYLPKGADTFGKLEDVAQHIISYAKSNGFYP